MRRALGFAAVAVLALSSCAKRPPAASAQSSERPGKPLDIRLPLFPGGEIHDLAEDRGSVVLLDVWATWCEPCREALPIYQQLLEQYSARGLKVYALSVDEDPRQIGPFLKEAKIALPVLIDKDAAVAERDLNVEVLPTSFILDRRGVIRYRHGVDVGAADFRARCRAEIESLLAERAP